MLTTAGVQEVLGISRARVRQLETSGRIVAGQRGSRGRGRQTQYLISTVKAEQNRRREVVT